MQIDLVKIFGKVALTAGLALLLTACGQTQRSYLKPAEQNKAPTAGVCKDGRYIVKTGDFISLIAQKCGVTTADLAIVNKIYPPYTIYPGQELILPSGSHQKSYQDLAVNWDWPVKHYQSYKVVQGENGVNGLEIYAEKGSLVQAVEAGEVVFADKSLSNFGNLVIIRHNKDYLTVYAHNDRLQVREGQKVAKGQEIANVGDSGNVEKPMLYFEARFMGQKVDVDKLLRAP